MLSAKEMKAAMDLMIHMLSLISDRNQLMDQLHTYSNHKSIMKWDAGLQAPDACLSFLLKVCCYVVLDYVRNKVG